MSNVPEVHYWASGMPRKEAQLYLLDLCGSDSQQYTETEAEVTCERCLAALRLDRAPPKPPPDPNGVLDRAVRAAVLQEHSAITRELLLRRGRKDSNELVTEMVAWIHRRGM